MALKKLTGLKSEVAVPLADFRGGGTLDEPKKRVRRRLQIYEGITTLSKRNGNLGPIGSTFKRRPNSDLKRPHVFGFSTE